MGDDRRVTFKCKACYTTQRGTDIELFQAGWVRTYYRITMAEKGMSGHLTQSQSRLVCPKCARQHITDIQDAFEERFANSPANPIEGWNH